MGDFKLIAITIGPSHLGYVFAIIDHSTQLEALQYKLALVQIEHELPVLQPPTPFSVGTETMHSGTMLDLFAPDQVQAQSDLDLQCRISQRAQVYIGSVNYN